MNEFKHVPCPKCSVINRLPRASSSMSQAKCGKCQENLNAEKNVRDVDLSSLNKIVLNSPVPVVVDFWAPWCGPCLAFAPTFEEYANKHSTNAIYCKLDTQGHPHAGTQFNIRGIPTLVLFSNEKEKARQSGALSFAALKSWLNLNGLPST